MPEPNVNAQILQRIVVKTKNREIYWNRAEFNNSPVVDQELEAEFPDQDERFSVHRLEPGKGLSKGTITGKVFWTGKYVMDFTDNGSGSLSFGPLRPEPPYTLNFPVSGIVDYNTGVFRLTWSTKPVKAASIAVTYKYAGNTGDPQLALDYVYFTGKTPYDGVTGSTGNVGGQTTNWGNIFDSGFPNPANPPPVVPPGQESYNWGLVLSDVRRHVLATVRKRSVIIYNSLSPVYTIEDMADTKNGLDDLFKVVDSQVIKPFLNWINTPVVVTANPPFNR